MELMVNGKNSSPGMLHLPSAPFTPFRVLDKCHVAKKDSMVQIKNKQNISFINLKKKEKKWNTRFSSLLLSYHSSSSSIPSPPPLPPAVTLATMPPDAAIYICQHIFPFCR